MKILALKLMQKDFMRLGITVFFLRKDYFKQRLIIIQNSQLITITLA